MNLKTKYFKIPFSLILIAGLLGFVSCEDYLDKSPESDISETEPFENFENFQGFTEELYNCIPCFTASAYHNSWNLGDDEIWCISGGQSQLGGYVDQGDYWKWNLYGSPFQAGTKNWDGRSFIKSEDSKEKGRLWGFSWYGIRKANVGIANLDRLTDATQEEKNLIEGQLYFFRAWFHFQIMKYWGGIPYINRVIPADEVFKEARLSYQEAADLAASDFRRAAELLPVDWDDIDVGTITLGNNKQRANKIMALAYLGKNLLYAGSPLMNEVSGGATEYNADYCQQAAEALGEALALSESTGRYKLVDFSEYSKLFYEQNSDNIPGKEETIFWENLVGGNGRFRWNQINDYLADGNSFGGYLLSPTANYVFGNYGMANGLPINDDRNVSEADAESGYDPEHPWRDRDPRFYKDIIVDGERSSVKEDKPDYIEFASLYSGGFYRSTNSENKKNRTGLMITKWKPRLAEYANESTTMYNMTVLSLMRLADVYLMYAEATAAGYGLNKTATSYSLNPAEAINVVRDRAEVGHVAEKFLTSVDVFMGELQRERAVELSFEGHRFCDLRRWKLLDKKPYTLKCSLEYERDPNGLTGAALAEDYKNARVLNLRMETLFERKFIEKHYWFPFLTEDVNIYPEFKQNPGW